MKILILHNRYQYKGGEDTVFEAESSLLKRQGHNVEEMIYDNKTIASFKEQILVGIRAFYNPESAKILKEKIHQFCPDIIHIHNFFPIASPSILFAAKKYNIPVVMTLHNYRLICPGATLYRKNAICEMCIQKKFAYPGFLHGCYRSSKIQTLLLATMSFLHTALQTWQTKVTRYIALTHFEKNKFLQSSLELPPSQITVKPNFTEDHGFCTQKENYFLYVGRLSEEKGLNTLLEAFKANSYELRIIGNGPLVQQVLTAADTFTNIHYLGFQNKSFIIESLKGAKALIFPSSCYETFGISIIEAFSTGTPVICTDSGAPAEIVSSHNTGLYFKVGDSDDLKAKIEWIEHHSETYQPMCLNARKEYESKYSPEKNYKMLLKIYKEAIDAKIQNS
jgi:glycosyltransferase involved in cell wall biosynthesis